MKVRAKHNFFIYNFFRIYTLLKIRTCFSSVTIHGDIIDRNLPVLVISNHISWWDGFWVMYLNMKRFRRKFHFMMLEEQLDKFSFFKHTGGFSVKKGSRSVLETISHARELLSDKENLVLVFPQGEIQSLYNSDFRFEKGTERIVSGKHNSIHIFLNANFIDYLSEQNPGLHIFVKEYSSGDISASALEKEYNDFYSACTEELIRSAGR